MEEKYKALLNYAAQAAKNAYAPYSKFSVGAALLCEDKSVYFGCNIENACYPMGLCAERVAFSKAVSEGHMKFKAIAIVGGRGDDLSVPCPPCGACRQVMSEFCDKDFEIILTDGVMTLGEALPKSFEL